MHLIEIRVPSYSAAGSVVLRLFERRPNTFVGGPPAGSKRIVVACIGSREVQDVSRTAFALHKENTTTTPAAARRRSGAGRLDSSNRTGALKG